jgi:hypothetical protein
VAALQKKDELPLNVSFLALQALAAFEGSVFFSFGAA